MTGFFYDRLHYLERASGMQNTKRIWTHNGEVQPYGIIARVLSYVIAVITTVLCDKKLRKIKNAFIVSLAVADFWVSSVTMPASIIGISAVHMKPSKGVLFGRQWFEHHYVVCAFTSTVCAPACMASVCSIAWIAVHRYFYIGQYGDCVIYFSRKRVLFYIFATWSFSFLIHLPNHLGWGQTRYSFMLRFCSIDTDLLSYAIFYSALVILALIVSFVFYVRIYHLLRSTNLAKRIIIGPENLLRKGKR
uniref:G-protein coupled receptors family 1 profile domain-containing protein n=1 Tax=Romanomermis culicivorax TaxID=13658 RepID=A0A915KM77_ROMCU